MSNRDYRERVHYLQYKVSALQALTRANRILKRAYVSITVCDPDVRALEAFRAEIAALDAAAVVALREARGMLNMDDSAIVPPEEPAA